MARFPLFPKTNTAHCTHKSFYLTHEERGENNFTVYELESWAYMKTYTN